MTDPVVEPEDRDVAVCEQEDPDNLPVGEDVDDSDLWAEED